jgi:hypothetical protein
VCLLSMSPSSMPMCGDMKLRVKLHEVSTKGARVGSRTLFLSGKVYHAVFCTREGG